MLQLPESKLRVIAPDVDGGFGSKIFLFLYPEDVALTWASKKVGRPIKWTAERSEAFLSDAYGRDYVTKAELALDSDGKFLAMRVHTTANMGAYLSTFASSIPTVLYAMLLAGQYTTPAIYAEVKAVFTNTVPVDASRGAGRPEATYVVERLVETAERELNVDPVELRRRNFIRTFPYATPVGLTYNIGDYDTCLDRALELADVTGFAARREASKQDGKLRGIGYSCYIEECGFAPSNVAGALGARGPVRGGGGARASDRLGHGVHRLAQSRIGARNDFAQVVADRLGVSIDNVEIIHGDTGRIPFGMGTYGSRSISVGGSAIMKVLDKVEAKAKKIAAHLLEAAAEDIEFKDGVFRVAGCVRSRSGHGRNAHPALHRRRRLRQRDQSDDRRRPGARRAGAGHRPGDAGALRLRRLDRPVAVRLVHGLRDAARDRPAELHRRDREGHAVHANSLGVKGCGKAGAIGSPPAVINAILDVLAPLGVKDLQMPATPHRV